MATGRQHLAATVGSAVAVLAYEAVSGFHTPNVAALSVGLLFGVIASPDQDVDNGFIGDYIMRKAGLGWWWFHLWKPYKLAMAHRSHLSHFPIISSVFRLIYLVFPPIINLTTNRNVVFRSFVATILSVPMMVIYFFIWYYRLETLFLDFIIGYIMSDIIHFLFDYL